ncbi:MAG: DUF2294 family protein [Phycisphaerae bacterium]|nr:DUF2294 family protein [Phycisphaerae bacterium]
MLSSTPTRAQQIAHAAIDFEWRTTGLRPGAITVVMSHDTVVITLHDALSRAERALAKSPEGAARLREFHQQLFSMASQSLRKEIRGILGVEVLAATAEVETATGAMVQLFALAQAVPGETWSGTSSGPEAAGKQ